MLLSSALGSCSLKIHHKLQAYGAYTKLASPSRCFFQINAEQIEISADEGDESAPTQPDASESELRLPLWDSLQSDDVRLLISSKVTPLVQLLSHK